MVTFPSDLDIRPVAGVNLAFGPNFSGKTTLVNAVKFGIFGLTLTRKDEDLSARSFADRIREKDRKSLDIIASFVINGKILTVKRTLFLSGPQSLDVEVVDPSLTPTGAIVESYKNSKEYLPSLSKLMGLDNPDEVEFVLDLMIADEERHFILWRKDLERVTLKLLVPHEELSQVRWLEHELEKRTREAVDANKAIRTLEIKLDRDQAVRRFFQAEAGRLTPQEQRVLLESAEKLRKVLAETDAEIEFIQTKTSEALSGKNAILHNHLKLQDDIQSCLIGIEEFRTRKYKAMLRSDRPEDVHVIKHLIHEKKCAVCSADLTAEVDSRQSKRLCILCGNMLDKYESVAIQDLTKEITAREHELVSLRETLHKAEIGIEKADDQIKKLAESLKERNETKQVTIAELSKLKDTLAIEQRIQVVREGVKALEGSIVSDGVEYDRLKKAAENLQSEKTQTENLLRNGSEIAKEKASLLFSRVQSLFGEFVKTATNGDVDARIGTDLVPLLRGRKIYSVDDASQFERSLLDMAFRVALVRTIAENTKSMPFLLVETPEETPDDSYLKSLAGAIRDFSKGVKMMITSSDSRFSQTLIDGMSPAERKLRLIDLSGSGTKTQKDYYKPMLNTWF